MGGNPSAQVTNGPSLYPIGLYDILLFCQVRSRDDRIKEICDLVRDPLNLSHHCAKFDTYRSCESEGFYFVTWHQVTT